LGNPRLAGEGQTVGRQGKPDNFAGIVNKTAKGESFWHEKG